MNVNEIVQFLSVDRGWNILTRNALELQLLDRETSFSAILIDFNNLHLMNRNIGYEQTDKEIKTFFTIFQIDASRLFNVDPVIGRWLCGDEVMIIVNVGQEFNIIKILNSISQELGIGVKTMLFSNLQSFKDLSERIKNIKW